MMKYPKLGSEGPEPLLSVMAEIERMDIKPNTLNTNLQSHDSNLLSLEDNLAPLSNNRSRISSTSTESELVTSSVGIFAEFQLPYFEEDVLPREGAQISDDGVEGDGEMKYYIESAGKPQKGKLEIVAINDSQFMLIFSSDKNIEANSSQTMLVTSEVEDARFLDNHDCVALVDDGFFVKIASHVEYTLLKEACDECKNIVNLNLRLNSIARDAYFSGFHSAASRLRSDRAAPDRKEIEASTSMLYNFSKNAPLFDELKDEFLFKPAVVEEKGKIKKSHKKKPATSSSKDKKSSASSAVSRREGSRFLHNKIKCIYCDVEKDRDPHRVYIVHPYCPVSHSDETITMCMPCAGNWDAYRSKLQSSLGLILAGEENEELCALCSDTPEQLVMCSFCPRSFCNNCLKRSVTPEMLRGLQKDDDADWACMSCVNGLGKKSSVNKKNWREVTEDMHTPVSKKVLRGSLYNSTDRYESMQEADTAMELATPSSSSSSRRNAKIQAMSEEHYFAQYVKHTDAVYAKCEEIELPKTEGMFFTDDACFLCKDGGDLIECDWKRSFGNRRGRCSCRKVYHEYCLAYSVPDNKTWICPRHYCDGCASNQLTYMCKYCPVSTCKDCLYDLAVTYGTTEYVELPVPAYGFEDHMEMKHIVCHTCLEMFNRLKCNGKFQNDGIPSSHPVFTAKRHHLDVGTNGKRSKKAKQGLMIKGAAPISMPPRGTVGFKRENNVLGKGGHLERPHKKKKKSPQTSPSSFDDNVGLEEEEALSVDWGEGLDFNDHHHEEESNLLAKKLQHHAAAASSPLSHKKAQDNSSRRFKLVLSHKHSVDGLVGDECTSEDDDDDDDEPSSKEAASLIEESSSTSNGSGSGDFITTTPLGSTTGASRRRESPRISGTTMSALSKRLL